MDPSAEKNGRDTANEKEFSQSESVTRCRHVKGELENTRPRDANLPNASKTRSSNAFLPEAKLKGYFSLAKLADEEVMIHQANLEEIRHNLQTRLKEQRSMAQRQAAEADDLESSGERKRQLIGLVDKLSTIKLLLRFQEEQRERELIFKSNIRQKRAAFQVRQAKLEQKQMAERIELMQAQNRLQETVNQVRAIEIRSMTDAAEARRRRKENEILAQQSKMKMQKEFEHLRELQICKARHMSQLNDVEILNAQENEELSSQHRQEEFEVFAKQRDEMQDALDEIEKQRRKIESSRQVEKQAQQTALFARAQKKQEKLITKQHRIASKNRERLILLENPLIAGAEAGDDILGSDDDSSCRLSSAFDTQSSQGGSLSFMNQNQEQERQLTEARGNNDDEDVDLTDEARLNSEKNKAESTAMNNNQTDEERDMASLNATSQERIRTLAIHHRKIITDLKNQHKSAINVKLKEHRRRISDLIKEQEEEIEAIKTDQAISMNELIQTQQQSDEVRKDSNSSQRLLGMMLPAHVVEDIEAGRTPEPKEFENVTIFFTDISEFKGLVTRLADPIAILHLLNLIYSRFDEIIMKYEDLYKVESVSDTYMVAAGLVNNDTTTTTTTNTTNTTNQPARSARVFAASAAKCAVELMEAFCAIDFQQFGIHEELYMRVGMHTGPVLAGIIGTKMSRYCLFGDTVNTASRMCTTSDAGLIQISTTTRELLDNLEELDFEVRGDVEIKGKGKMTTHWLSTDSLGKARAYSHNGSMSSLDNLHSKRAVKFE